MSNQRGSSTDKNIPGVLGENLEGVGVQGTSQKGNGVRGLSESAYGVHGGSKSHHGVGGHSELGCGVWGVSKKGPGVRGDAEDGDGVFGYSKGNTAVHGMSESGDGVLGTGRRGVVGRSQTYQGVYGWSDANAGVVGESVNMHAIYGICHNPDGAGVFGTNDKNGIGIQAESAGGVGLLAKGGKLAGRFEGNVEVNGNINVSGDVFLANADCAEDFDIIDTASAEPGTVMVLGEEGALQQSYRAYDKRVAGVVSGAGDYKPGIILDKQQSVNERKPIALLGKVFCKVDAQYGAIEVGDLLTTSETPGHAMKAAEPLNAFGAVIGKALRPLREGQGLVPILIALQ